ncbi:MAG: hypothetical protein QM669_07410 [Siphonobacter sp.]
MSIRYGKCLNVDNCQKARSGEIIERQEPQKFICPDCGEYLMEVTKPTSERKRGLGSIWIGLLLAAILTGVALFINQYLTSSPQPGQEGPVTVQKGDKLQSKKAEEENKKEEYPVAGTKVEGSETCKDCESFFMVHNGKGGNQLQSEGYSTRCCKCGSIVAFSDGYYYDIICDGDQITAKMSKKVEE